MPEQAPALIDWLGVRNASFVAAAGLVVSLWVALPNPLADAVTVAAPARVSR